VEGCGVPLRADTEAAPKELEREESEMEIELKHSSARLTLDRHELRLLRYALERASFIDTPSSEQPGIAAFCSRALDLLSANRMDAPA
jgi:hypothetical protein